jgi:hypothetical protein
MFRKRPWLWGSSVTLVLMLIVFGWWLFLPPRMYRQIQPGMTRAQVEALTGQQPKGSMLWSTVSSERYETPDGNLIVEYRSPADMTDLWQPDDVVVSRELLRVSLWERFRTWLRR